MALLSVRRLLVSAGLVAGALAVVPASATAAGAPRPGRDYVADQVVVRYARGSVATASAAGRVAGPRTRVLTIRDGSSVEAKAAALRRKEGVVSATPNWIARISGFVPNDPGREPFPGGWQAIQWNFLPGTGVNAPDAWDNLIRAGKPGGRGVTVAVLDTGVAYANRGRFRRSPDLSAKRFKRGYDFVDGDKYPNDHNGHGTHVASTIAETAGNGIGVTGLAYGASIMPVRVLDRVGEGDSVAISRGIRFAARRGAKIINLSFEFSSTVTADQIPDILSALRYARSKGVLVVGASGNASASAVAYPARASRVLSVGAVTEHLCQADYANVGAGLDIVAPGGGPDAALDAEPDRCRPHEPPGRDIYQYTFTGSVRRFGLPGGYMGTSMAAPHVSAISALVVASGVLGPDPSPTAIEQHLKATSVDLGRPGPDPRYGTGLVDAARATAPPPAG
jgi:serine protease